MPNRQRHTRRGGRRPGHPDHPGPSAGDREGLVLCPLGRPHGRCAALRITALCVAALTLLLATHAPGRSGVHRHRTSPRPVTTGPGHTAIVTSPDPAFTNPFPGWGFGGLGYGFGIGGVWVGIEHFCPTDPSEMTPAPNNGYDGHNRQGGDLSDPRHPPAPFAGSPLRRAAVTAGTSTSTTCPGCRGEKRPALRRPASGRRPSRRGCATPCASASMPSSLATAFMTGGRVTAYPVDAPGAGPHCPEPVLVP